MKSAEIRNARGELATHRTVLHREARTDWQAVDETEARALLAAAQIKACGCSHAEGAHVSDNGPGRYCSMCTCSNFVPERVFGGEPLEGELRGDCCQHMEGVHRLDGTCSIPGCICDDFVAGDELAEGA